MNIKQNPFSFYDFLGYFTPGAIFLYGVLLITGHVSGSNIFVYAEKYLSFKNAEAGRYRTPCIDIHRLHFLVKKYPSETEIGQTIGILLKADQSCHPALK